MKNIAIAVAIGAACTNFANAGDLNFDLDSEINQLVECMPVSLEFECGTVAYNFGGEAYGAYLDEQFAASVVEDVAADVAFATSALDEAEKAVLAASDADKAGAEALRDLSKANLADAEAALANANEQLASATSYVETFSGDIVDVAIDYAKAETSLIDANNAVNEASINADLADGDALIAQANIDQAQDFRDAALQDYVAATEALNNDPDNAVLAENKVNAAKDLSSAGSQLKATIDASSSVMAARDLAAEELSAAMLAADSSLQALDEATVTLTDTLSDWEVVLETTVVEAEYLLDAQTELLDLAKADLADAESNLASAQSSADEASAASDLADLALADAEKAADDAQAAFDSLAADATDEQIDEALLALNEAQDASAKAFIASSDADIQVTQTNADLVIATNAASAVSLTVAEAEGDVALASDNLDETKAELEIHADYIGNESNPANALMNALVTEEDHAQAVVSAVSDTYGFTVVNSEGVAANLAAINLNTAGIASNQESIVENTAQIASNRMDIDANSASISQLSDDLDVLRSGVAASLAAAGMPVAPGEGWGAAIGTGYFDGESAIAAGVTYRAERYNFKLSLGASGGETSASAGMAWDL